MQFLRKSDDIRDAHFDVEELQNSEHSRRSFLTRSAASAIGVAGGAAVLNAVMAAPAGAAAGDTHLIAPVRVFDSRPSQPFSGTGSPGTFTYTGAPVARIVLFGDDTTDTDLVPAGSAGAIINLTVTATVATGAFGVTHGGVIAPAAPAASLINWFGASQNLANSAIVPLGLNDSKAGNDTVSAIRVWSIAGTAGVSSAHYIVDCFGYIE